MTSKDRVLEFYPTAYEVHQDGVTRIIAASAHGQTFLGMGRDAAAAWGNADEALASENDE